MKVFQTLDHDASILAFLELGTDCCPALTGEGLPKGLRIGRSAKGAPIAFLPARYLAKDGSGE